MIFPKLTSFTSFCTLLVICLHGPHCDSSIGLCFGWGAITAGQEFHRSRTSRCLGNCPTTAVLPTEMTVSFLREQKDVIFIISKAKWFYLSFWKPSPSTTFSILRRQHPNINATMAILAPPVKEKWFFLHVFEWNPMYQVCCVDLCFHPFERKSCLANSVKQQGANRAHLFVYFLTYFHQEEK